MNMGALREREEVVERHKQALQIDEVDGVHDEATVVTRGCATSSSSKTWVNMEITQEPSQEQNQVAEVYKALKEGDSHVTKQPSGVGSSSGAAGASASGSSEQGKEEGKSVRNWSLLKRSTWWKWGKGDEKDDERKSPGGDPPSHSEPSSEPEMVPCRYTVKVYPGAGQRFHDASETQSQIKTACMIANSGMRLEAHEGTTNSLGENSSRAEVEEIRGVKQIEGFNVHNRNFKEHLIYKFCIPTSTKTSNNPGRLLRYCDTFTPIIVGSWDVSKENASEAANYTFKVNWLRSFVVRAYFAKVVNGGVNGVCLDTLHAFWLWQAKRKNVEGNIDEEARGARA
ncbi:unnamed protein product [Sphagnum troendelagicum]